MSFIYNVDDVYIIFNRIIFHVRLRRLKSKSALLEEEVHVAQRGRASVTLQPEASI